MAIIGLPIKCCCSEECDLQIIDLEMLEPDPATKQRVWKFIVSRPSEHIHISLSNDNVMCFLKMDSKK